MNNKIKVFLVVAGITILLASFVGLKYVSNSDNSPHGSIDASAPNSDADLLITLAEEDFPPDIAEISPEIMLPPRRDEPLTPLLPEHYNLAGVVHAG